MDSMTTKEVELDPHIQAFTILSDRVSNLEEGLSGILESAKLQEQRVYGSLNHRLLGIPFPVFRHPAVSNEPYQQPLPTVSNLVIEMQGAKLLCWCSHKDFCKIMPFTSEELQRILEKDRFEELVTCREVGIHSAHRHICGEALERHIHRVTTENPRLYKELSRCSIQPFTSDDGNPAFLLSGQDDLSMRLDLLLAETVRVLRTVGLKEANALHLYETTEDTLCFVRSYCEWKFSGDEEKRRQATERMQPFPDNLFDAKRQTFFCCLETGQYRP